MEFEGGDTKATWTLSVASTAAGRLKSTNFADGSSFGTQAMISLGPESQSLSDLLYLVARMVLLTVSCRS